MPSDEDIAAVRRAIQTLANMEDPRCREVAAAARDALQSLESGMDWRARLLSDETVEAVAGELFAQDALDGIRDAMGGWRKDRLRRAARALLAVGVEAATSPDAHSTE
jgi:predicted DNA-binding transcriptional regulator YafY